MSINSKMTQKSLKQVEQITGVKLTLGKFLCAIRQAEGDTQVGFADKLGISKQHLCDIEHERKSVSPKLAADYAKKLGYSEEHFIRLCLQDMVDRDKLGVIIEIKIKSKKGRGGKLAYAD